MTTLDWVIDAQILVDADNNVVDHGHLQNVLQLLTDIRKNNQPFCVDHYFYVLGQYRKNLNPTGTIAALLNDFMSRNQIRFVDDHPPRKLLNELRNLQFDEDDLVFVGIACHSSSGFLVAEESDYTAEIIDLLARHGVKVLDCQCACSKSNG